MNRGTIYVGTTGSSADWVEIDSSGIDVMKNNVSMANFANSSVRLGADANNSSFVTIDTNSMDFVTDSGGSNTTRAAFSDAGIILGSTGHAHISASTHDITIKE